MQESHAGVVRACVTLLFFFFQAEDGIRAHCVTGVQTCALPISARVAAVVASPPERGKVGELLLFLFPEDLQRRPRRGPVDRWSEASRSVLGRSEERRVGKEERLGRCRD